MIRAVFALAVMAGTAAAAEPLFCKGYVVKDRDEAWAESAENALKEYRGSHHSQHRLIQAARYACNGVGSRQATKVATEIVTAWMKETGLDEAHAQESLAARVDGDRWDAAKDKLCEAMPDESSHLGDARKRLFGCLGDPLWLAPLNAVDLEDEIDRGPAAHDDLAHLAWMLHRAGVDLDTTEKDALVGYVIDQVDFRVLPTDAALMHELDAAPFDKNRYARVVLMESLGSLRQQVARVEAAVNAKDAKWREVVVDGPAQAIEQWEKAAAKSKDVLADADAPPKAGCAKRLREGLTPIMTGLPHKTLREALDAISDHPLAGYLLNRWSKCLLKENDTQLGQSIGQLASAVRQKPGPRWAAYYGALDAISKQGDAPAVKPTHVPLLDSHHDSGYHESWDNLGTFAVVASIGGGKVNFVQKKVQVMDQECHETNRIDRVLPDGKVQYRQICRDKGLVWITDGPLPVILDKRFTDQIKVGRMIRFDHDLNSQPATPLYVYADGRKSKLLALGTFLLP